MRHEQGKPHPLRRLEDDISAFAAGRAVAVLSRDPLTGMFRAPLGDKDAQRNSRAVASIDGTDRIITGLLAGGEWVHRDRAVRPDPRGGEPRSATETVFPVMVGGCLDHVLTIGGGLPESDARLIAACCRQAGLALDTDAIRVDLDGKIERLSALVRLVDDLAAERNEHKLLQTMLDQSAELLLAEQGSFMLVENETGQLLVEASRGASRDRDGGIRITRGSEIAGQVAASGEAILVEDIERDPRIGRKNRERYQSPSFVSVPLKLDGRVIGVMNFNDKHTGSLFDGIDLQLALTCASHAAVVLDRRQIYEQTEKLARRATVDDLTGLFNRGFILERLRGELARSGRYANVTSVALLDIDGFKHINDGSGHARGDQVLRRVSELMASAVRSIDIVGRYGGDEFLIILPETDAFFAAQIAERVRSDIEHADLQSGTGQQRVTTSIGIATFPVHGTNAEVLLEHADTALYRAKEGGRNRVIVY